MAKRAPKNKEANRAVQFINNLKLTGDYYGIQVKLRQWQEDIVRRIFGTLNKDGTRRYRKVFLFLPRGSAKTTLASQIVLYSLLGLGTPSQQIISAATSREQAATLFGYAKQAIEQDTYLRDYVEIVDSKKRLVLPTKHSAYWAISSDAAGGLGHNPNILIVDELEAWCGRDVELYQNLTTSMGKRQQTITILIATGSTERHPLLVQELDYAKKVEADPSIDPTYLPILYYAKDTEQWDDEAVWKRVHPALDDFFSLDFMRKEAEQAKQIPARQSTFEAYYLNRLTTSIRTWIPDDQWQENAEPPTDDTEEMVFTAGLDLASVKDSNALVLYGKRPDGRFDIRPYFWVAEKQVEQRTSADHDYALWCKTGLIKPTGGATADQEAIFADIMEICARYDVRLIACDPYGARQWLAPELEKAGIAIKYIPQTVSYMSPALKELERKALNCQLCHGGNPVLRWQLGCASVRPDGNNNYFLNKSKSSDQVDGVSALSSAIACWQLEHLDDQTEAGEPAIFFV